ncbi:MAG: O-antigen polymerase, partial [Deltaproteobacteria bacterium]|nr:O-antigen polymerase [Deltaproteobacteria bacterium]
LEAHNDYIDFLAETGIFFVPILLWLAVSTYKAGWKKLRHHSRLVRYTTLGALSGITAILIHSMADFSLHVPANAAMLALLAAIAVMAPQVRSRRNGWLASP